MSSPRAPADSSGGPGPGSAADGAASRGIAAARGGGAGRASRTERRSEPDDPDAATASVARAKRTARSGVRIRRRARATLASDDPRRRQEAEAIAAAILARLPHPPRPEGPNAERTSGPGALTVASYVALPTEPPTAALHAALTARGIHVIVPVLLPDKDLDWVLLGTEAPPLGREGIGAARLVVVPALLVDRGGRRLGQGGGSYDRALGRRHADAEVVAVVDDDGLVDQVPHEPHDALVTAVVRPASGWTDLPLREPICENHSAREEP